MVYVLSLWRLFDEGHEQVPSMILAWDSATLDANPDGWPAEKARVLAEHGIMEADVREVRLETPDLLEFVLERFGPGTIKTTGYSEAQRT